MWLAVIISVYLAVEVLSHLSCDNAECVKVENRKDMSKRFQSYPFPVSSEHMLFCPVFERIHYNCRTTVFCESSKFVLRGSAFWFPIEYTLTASVGVID